MVQLAVMFILQKRHHYNKAMLSTISDCLHHEAVIPQWKTTFSSYMNVFTEKKVEVFHSLLRMQCPSWSNSAQIAEFAHVLSAKKFDSEFSQNFLAARLRKGVKHNVTLLAGKTAEYLVRKFRTLYENSEDVREIRGRSRTSRTYRLNVLTGEVDQKCMPLAYSTERPPSQEVLCDSESCAESTAINAVLLSCGHCFHISCLRQSSTCPICEPFIIDRIKALCSTFNKNLRTERIHEEEDEESENIEEDNEDELDEETNEYYGTSEFQQHLLGQILQLPRSVKLPKFISEKQRKEAEPDVSQRYNIVRFSRFHVSR